MSTTSASAPAAASSRARSRKSPRAPIAAPTRSRPRASLVESGRSRASRRSLFVISPRMRRSASISGSFSTRFAYSSRSASAASMPGAAVTRR